MIDTIKQLLTPSNPTQHHSKNGHTQLSNNLRVLLYSPYCNHCRQWAGVIEEWNLKAKHDKHIKKISTRSQHPLVTLFQQQDFFNGQTPFLYFEGITVSGSIDQTFNVAFIENLMHDNLRTIN